MASYDWLGFRQRWEGLFSPAIRKVQKQVHDELTIDDGAVDMLDGLMYALLAHLCVQEAQVPLTKEQCNEAILKVFPEELGSWAVQEAEEELSLHLEKSTKRKPFFRTEFPTKSVHARFVSEVIKDRNSRMELTTALYLMAVLDYVTADILKLSGNYTINCDSKVIKDADINIAMNADPVLQKLYSLLQKIPAPEVKAPVAMKYIDVIREMMSVEASHIAELDTVIKVFLDVFEGKPTLFTEQEIETVFDSIREIAEFSTNRRSLLEDAIEMVEQRSDITYPLIGACFEDLAMDHEFGVYEDYGKNYPEAMRTLEELQQRPAVMAFFEHISPHYVTAIKYELPELLLAPVYHLHHTVELLELLISSIPEDDTAEKASLREALVMIKPIAAQLSPKSCPFVQKRPTYLKFKKHLISQIQASFSQLQQRIEGFDGQDIAMSCTELLKDSRVHVWSEKKKGKVERVLWVFNGLVICCKPITHKDYAYRLKMKMPTRGLLVEYAQDDSGEYGGHAIRVKTQDHRACLVLCCDSEAEREDWFSVITRPTIKRFLRSFVNQKTAEYEQQLPKLVPDASIYPFAEEDSSSNIRFESLDPPVIKAGTLLKLVERLTYPQYADTNFLREFLTTYRTYCTKEQLLDLLVLRYNIPNPNFADASMIKRFQKKYEVPVRLRVLNVFKHWIEKHYYDFETSPDLLKRLLTFIRDVLAPDPTMRKAVGGLTKSIRKRREMSENPKEVVWSEPPPDFVWFPGEIPVLLHVLTLHPIEVARQLTLIESELYRNVKPSELVGQMWSKEGKEENAPNVLALVHRFNTVNYWVIRTIVETENFQERVDVLNFFLEILRELLFLNNFNGVMEIVSALHNSAIDRLSFTWGAISEKRKRVLEQCEALTNRDKSYANLRQALGTVNPPCIPFFGMYLSDITFIEDGSPDYLPTEDGANSKLINFGKRRLVAKTTGEILLYQNQPYCLDVEPSIRAYLITFPSLLTNPIPLPAANAPKVDKENFENMIYDQSKKIEPRGVTDKAQLPQAPPNLDDGKAAKTRREEINFTTKTRKLRNSVSSGRPSLPDLFGRKDSTTSRGSLGGTASSILRAARTAAKGPDRPPKRGSISSLNRSSISNSSLASLSDASEDDPFSLHRSSSVTSVTSVSSFRRGTDEKPPPRPPKRFSMSGDTNA